MTALTGRPSDAVDEILAVGRTGVTTLFVSMAARHPDGGDADYLRWHTLDHRPEQHRIPALRASLRLVSTPACRAARAAADERYDAIDHVMTYFFSAASGLAAFEDLSTALRDAGRTPYVLPPVERGVYDVGEVAADAAIKAGADVLPWWPATGVYLLVEPRSVSAADLVDVAGVAGAWSAVAVDAGGDLSTAEAGQQVTYCFLDDDPVATAERLRPVLARRWEAASLTPLLAAPFHPVVPHEWHRYLP